MITDNEVCLPKRGLARVGKGLPKGDWYFPELDWYFPEFVERKTYNLAKKSLSLLTRERTLLIFQS